MNYLGLKIIKDYQASYFTTLWKAPQYFADISLLFVNHNLSYYIKIKLNNRGDLFYSKRYCTRLNKFIIRLQKYGITISKIKP